MTAPDVLPQLVRADYRGSALDRALVTNYDATFAEFKHFAATTQAFDAEKARVYAEIREAAKQVLSQKYAAELSEHPVDELGEYPLDVPPSSLRLLRAANLTTLADLAPYAKSQWGFAKLRGIGEVRSSEIHAAYVKLRAEVRANTRITFTGELTDAEVALLGRLQQLKTLLIAERSLTKFGHQRDASVRLTKSTFGIAEPIRNKASWWFPNSGSKVAARQNIARMLGAARQAPVADAQVAFDRYFYAVSAQRAQPEGRIVRDFRAEPAAFYALLAAFIAPSAGQVGFEETAAAGALGHAGTDLNEGLWTAVSKTELDLDGFTAILRPYQEFGVKFMVHQRRTILGDDMGLGKTIQALAYMVHVTNKYEAARAKRPTHLIIAPLSVQLNWAKEIAKHSALSTHLLASKRDEIPANVDIVVATYERATDLLKKRITGAVVVDEAHFIKNADTGRTQRVRALIEDKRDVVFMSGTALENNLEEMTRLMGYVSPEVGEKLLNMGSYATPETYRAALAEGYLRRNKEDVLKELPELVEKEELIQMSAAEREHYVELLGQDHPWHALRQLGYRAVNYAKVERIAEIIEDAAAKGEKVLLFSFYLNSLSVLQERFAHLPQVRIDGEVAPDERQPLIDRFNAHAGTMLYFSQINTGGVGLNLQAASRVIILEPQIKPSLTTQAIARAHRMGQLNSVFVHTLITQDSLDEDLSALEKSKQEVFDTYAKRSDIGDRSAGVEITAAEQRQILAAQKAKYGVA